MTFLKNLIKLKNIKHEKIILLKKYQRRLFKKRNIFLNSADRWRKSAYFKNTFSKNSYSWVFSSKFNFYIFFKKNVKTPLTSLNVNRSLFINTINIDKYCNLISTRLSFIILYFKNFIFFLPINLSLLNNNISIFINKNFSSFEFHNSYLFWLNFWLLSIIKKWFFKILKNTFNYVFLKLKYKGKNYRWHRKKRGLVLRFGHSHLIYMRKPISVFLKKKGRMKIIFFGTNIELIYFFLRNAIRWKPSNVYTGRGLRLSRQRLLKKAGKVSAYR